MYVPGHILCKNSKSKGSYMFGKDSNFKGAGDSTLSHLRRLFKSFCLSSLPVWVCRGVLGMVFFYAGVIKIGDPIAFAGVIESYGLLPEIAVLPVALVLPALEMVAAIGLLFNIRGALTSITALLLLFIVVIGYGLWIGLDIDCGCFDTGNFEYRFFKGLKGALYRDLFLLVPLIYIYWQIRNRIAIQVRENGYAG